MKNLFATLFLIGITLVTTAQSIQIGKDQCSHCNMLIRDLRFAALAEDHQDFLKFDAVECLINYLNEDEASDYKRLLVADYSGNGSWVDASAAVYLKCTAIPSPMGAYLTAHKNLSDAKNIQKGKGGELHSWAEIRKRFKDSGFGLLDHPDHQHNRPDAYAPNGVMGDHVHHRGSIMIGLRYMHMNMSGNLEGTDQVSDANVHKRYMVVPQRMSMDMCMLGVMWAPTDKLTLMLMQPFTYNRMDLLTRADMSFQTRSSGLGDIRVSALYSFFGNEKTSLHLNSGLSIPKGKVNKVYDTPMVLDMKLPYPMQIGSGTLDLTAGFTFKQAYRKSSWGVQQLNTIRTGSNNEGYRLGHKFELNTWASYNLTGWVCLSGRLETLVLTWTIGEDEDLNPMMSPAASTLNSGFIRLSSFIGTNFSFGTDPIWKNIKASIEYGLPLYQDVRGIQMQTQNSLTAGVKYLL